MVRFAVRKDRRSAPWALRGRPLGPAWSRGGSEDSPHARQPRSIEALTQLQRCHEAELAGGPGSLPGRGRHGLAVQRGRRRRGPHAQQLEGCAEAGRSGDGGVLRPLASAGSGSPPPRCCRPQQEQSTFLRIARRQITPPAALQPARPAAACTASPPPPYCPAPPACRRWGLHHIQGPSPPTPTLRVKPPCPRTPPAPLPHRA